MVRRWRAVAAFGLANWLLDPETRKRRHHVQFFGSNAASKNRQKGVKKLKSMQCREGTKQNQQTKSRKQNMNRDLEFDYVAQRKQIKNASSLEFITGCRRAAQQSRALYNFV
uniref:Uncharacterized protein n=1 Tax=Ceratitis capitata TaxID=7213 RepID=W8BKK4_CERCA